MHSESDDYSIPSHYHYENYGSFELDRGVVSDKTTGLCSQIFCPTHFYSGGTCIATTRVFTVMTAATAACWVPGTWFWVYGNVILGEVFVGVGAGLTGIATLMTCAREENRRRCCSDVIGCAADVALLSILVSD